MTQEIVKPRWLQLTLIVALLNISGMAWGVNASAPRALTPQGQVLQAEYAQALNRLQVELRKSLPSVDP